VKQTVVVVTVMMAEEDRLYAEGLRDAIDTACDKDGVEVVTELQIVRVPV
jgi:hypothetical protein